MRTIDTLFYLMGEKNYSGCEQENVNQMATNKEILVIGNMPNWISDLKIIMHNYEFKSVSLGEVKGNDIVLITKNEDILPNNVKVLDATKGKKNLWASIKLSGLI